MNRFTKKVHEKVQKEDSLESEYCLVSTDDVIAHCYMFSGRECRPQPETMAKKQNIYLKKTYILCRNAIEMDKKKKKSSVSGDIFFF